MSGWGSAVGRIFDWLPGRRESYRNKIDKIKREMDAIQSKNDFSNADADKYIKLAGKLQNLESKARNG